ncbi:unnamed protein product, partial [Enterobius vermicularis]|uniref:Uncharacterized protein n=1 Tax=Enterobius vermicularis TaxID=51028 RepID=A0A0N4UTR2_ENTVE
MCVRGSSSCLAIGYTEDSCILWKYVMIEEDSPMTENFYLKDTSNRFDNTTCVEKSAINYIVKQQAANCSHPHISPSEIPACYFEENTILVLSIFLDLPNKVHGKTFHRLRLRTVRSNAQWQLLSLAGRAARILNAMGFAK